MKRHFEDKSLNFSPSKVSSKILGVELHRDWIDKEYKYGYYKNYNIEEELSYLLKYSYYRGDIKFLLNRYPDNKLDIFMGIISCFNFEDMYYYLYHFNEKKRPKWCIEKQDEIEKKLDYKFGWILSPSTLKLVENIKKPEKWNGIKHSWMIFYNKIEL